MSLRTSLKNTSSRLHPILTLNVLCISESGIEMKIKLNIYFHIFYGGSKSFMKAFKAGIGTGKVK